MQPCNANSAAHTARAALMGWTALLLLAVLASGSPPCRAEEARAATHAPALDRQRIPNDAGFLAGFSFTSTREPISVTADGLEFNYRTRVLIYKGNVVVTQGDMKLQSDTLTVALDDHADNRINEVVADGQVRLSKGTRWATGGHAVFDHGQNTVVLSQNAELHDGPNQVSGDRVVVYLDQERSVVEGGTGRVRAVLFPSTPGAGPTSAPERLTAEGAP